MRLAIIIIFGLIGIHVCLWFGRIYLPGFAGEICGKIQGFCITPFFMEFLLIVFGLFMVLVINHFRQKWEGDELVYLEVVDDPTVQLPAHSKSVILPQREDTGDPVEVIVASIEGALALNEVAEARDLFSQIPENKYSHPAVQALNQKLNNPS